MKDMLDYTHEFPVKLIPHVTDKGINDIIHCYKRPKDPSKEDGQKTPVDNTQQSPSHSITKQTNQMPDSNFNSLSQLNPNEKESKNIHSQEQK